MYSRTWMRSTRMWMVTLRRAASARIRSSWWRAPPTTTTTTTGTIGSGVEGGGRGHDVVGPAGCGVGVVDGTQGRHPLAALLLAAGQAGPVAVGALDGGGLAGGLAQRVRTHHDALAVDAEDQQRVVGGWLRRRGGVEGVDV